MINWENDIYETPYGMDTDVIKFSKLKQSYILDISIEILDYVEKTTQAID